MFAEWRSVDEKLALAIGDWGAAALLGYLVEQEWEMRAKQMVDDFGAFKVSPGPRYCFPDDERLMQSLNVLSQNKLVFFDKHRRMVQLPGEEELDSKIKYLKGQL